MPVTLGTLTAARSSPLLRELSDNELAKLADLMDVVTFAKGDRIFEQDGGGDEMYVLLSGQVGVARKGAKDRDKERLLAVVGEGECIGEMALADNGPRSATVSALEEVRALRLDNAQFQTLRDSDPKMAIKMTLGIFRLLSKRIRQIDKNLEIVHYWMFA